MIRTIIRSTGRYLPARKVTNEDLAQWMDTSDEWIRQRTGIEQRYWVPAEGGAGPADLALPAAQQALQRAGWSAENLDLIIFATLNPDLFFPGSGCLLQDMLGLETTPALDIRQQCTGFLYGLTTADAYIRSGLAKRILFVGAEVHSSGLDISTRGRDVAVIFGDGAAAVCLEAVEGDSGQGVLASALFAQGKLATSLMIEAPAAKYQPRIDEKMLAEGRHFPTMDGPRIFKTAVRRMPEATRQVLDKADLNLEDVDLVIPHQANLRINQAFGQALGIPPEKIFHNIQRYGNTTAASIPLALDETIEKGLVKPGSTLLFVGLGAGVTWGAVLYRWPYDLTPLQQGGEG